MSSVCGWKLKNIYINYGIRSCEMYVCIPYLLPLKKTNNPVFTAKKAHTLAHFLDTI